ncbi:MAG TPA: hypothetical protein VGD67_21710, partial [Pseudonocardiaceae bacterium]
MTDASTETTKADDPEQRARAAAEYEADAPLREAKRRQAIAEANRAALAAEIGPYVPDLSKVQAGSLTIEGDEAVAAAAVLGHALRTAAAQVAVPAAVLGVEDTVLVTTDPDLAGSDAVHGHVARRLA